jgi:hypothetical protein
VCLKWCCTKYMSCSKVRIVHRKIGNLSPSVRMGETSVFTITISSAGGSRRVWKQPTIYRCLCLSKRLGDSVNKGMTTRLRNARCALETTQCIESCKPSSSSIGPCEPQRQGRSWPINPRPLPPTKSFGGLLLSHYPLRIIYMHCLPAASDYIDGRAQ